MSVKDPNGILGKAESDVLEFKAKDILKSPGKVAREVVAFLNKKGGDIWIGYPEQGGVAGIPEVIPDAERALSALQNHLIDTIEPPVQIPDEIELQGANGQIHVSVKKGRNGPYAQRDGGRHFWIRVGDRLRDMARDEIAEGFRSHKNREGQLGDVVAEMRRAQEKAVRETPSSLWLRLVPSEPLSIDLDDEATKKHFREWLMDARATGNRPSGWTFANNLANPKFFADRATHGDRAFKWMEVKPTGQVTFTLDRDSLNRKGSESNPKNLSPYLLIEYPVSVLRLMATILKYFRNGHGKRIVAGFAISGLRGWRLSSAARPWEEPRTFEKDILEIDPEQLDFDEDKFRENPDQSGLRLVRLIYGAFDFESEAIPPVFDQQQGVVRLG